MQFASALSTQPETQDALEEVCRGVSEQLESADLAVLFVSQQHGPDLQRSCGKSTSDCAPSV